MQDFTFIPSNNKWLKSRGYLHLTEKINTKKREKELYSKILNPDFVRKHAFFPLIHATIKERKYKKHPNTNLRSHVHKTISSDGEIKYKRTVKNRPLHYATHIDALIFSYYAAWLIDLYEAKIKSIPGLYEASIAYRKIPRYDNQNVSEKNHENLDADPLDKIEKKRHKGNIHFAKEAFEEIRKRSKNGCVALLFDIESFFSRLDHDRLKLAWANILNRVNPDNGANYNTLPPDHYNVFKACTKFNYILRDDLRIKHISNGRRTGFDERQLAHIRSNYGIEAFFASPKELRNAIADRSIKVYKKQFVYNGKQVGIPQGLPISAVLANIYLLEFDQNILSEAVFSDFNCYYRRYSDDILIICKPEHEQQIKEIVRNNIKKVSLTISEHKTESFAFNEGELLKGKRLTYLGFEFDGSNILVKSANIAKFYRRMIHAVRVKADRAKKIALRDGGPTIIFKSRLGKLYKRTNLQAQREKEFKRKKLVRSVTGKFRYKINIEKVNDDKENAKKKGNYISYMKRASQTIGSKKLVSQIKKRRAIFHMALSKHIKRVDRFM